jgi:hypothetical protein
MFSIHCREQALGTGDADHDAFVVRAAASEPLEIRKSEGIHGIGDNLGGRSCVVRSAGAG